MALWFPGQLLDPDLLAYFVFFQDWTTGSGILEGATYFNHPKPVLVLLLGPLGNVWLACGVSAVLAGVLGLVIYELGKACFDRTQGIVWSVLLLLDPARLFLAVKSSADFFLALTLFLAILLLVRKHPFWAACALLVAGLVKPVAIPCGLQLLLGEGKLWRRAALAVLPLLALPATLLGNALLLGSALEPGGFLAQFAALRGQQGMPPTQLPHHIFWVMLTEVRFPVMALFGFLGLVLWVKDGTARLLHPLFLVPLLFVAGYVALAFVEPYIPYFRFFWPIQIWFLGFAASAACTIFRLLPCERRGVALACSAIFAWGFLSDAYQEFLRYRETFAAPMEASRKFLVEAETMLAERRNAGEDVLVPLASESFFLWRSAPDPLGNPFRTAESAVLAGLPRLPRWIVHSPNSYLHPTAASSVEGLLASDHYELVHRSDEGSIHRLKSGE